jgi:hypothetical protein
VRSGQEKLTSGLPGFGTADWSFHGIHPSDQLSQSIAGVGDVNGDGFDDLAVGMPGWAPSYPLTDNGEYGRVYLFFGSAAGISATNVQIIDGVQELQRNSTIVRAGDVNGDGYADVLIEGELNYNTYPVGAPAGETGVQLYLGGPSGLAATPVWNLPYDGLKPRALGGVGDLDGDGRAEVLISISTLNATTGFYDYTLQVYSGTATGLSATPTWTFAPSQCLITGAGVGDITGDGYNDIVMGGDPACTGAPGSGDAELDRRARLVVVDRIRNRGPR